MDVLAQSSDSEREAVFNEAAARLDLTPAIVEKDFWVCWTLQKVLAAQKPDVRLLFKGGTSLSKAFGLISRFSEDIDLSLHRHDLGFTEARDPADPTASNKLRKRLLDELHTATTRYVADEIQPRLHHEMGPIAERDAALRIDTHDSQTVLFAYPAVFGAIPDVRQYVQPVVRLEFGGRSDHSPATQTTIAPYVSEVFPDSNFGALQGVPTLAPERTFWEKATILHMLANASTDRPLADRMSRHYYDFAMLLQSSVGPAAAADVSLLDAVATHKATFFRAGWAKYEDATQGTLRLLPSQSLLNALRRDYQDMATMFSAPPPSFDTIIEQLATFEATFNLDMARASSVDNTAGESLGSTLLNAISNYEQSSESVDAWRLLRTYEAARDARLSGTDLSVDATRSLSAVSTSLSSLKKAATDYAREAGLTLNRSVESNKDRER